MQEYDNTNSGTFFVNDRKQQPNHPDYSGKVNIEGKEYYIKGWKKVSKSGTNFLSLAFNPVEGSASTAAPKKPTAPAVDEVPF